MDDAVSTMIEWFLELSEPGRDPGDHGLNAWWDLFVRLPVNDQVRLARWYEDI